jgi:hypothetical protein
MIIYSINESAWLEPEIDELAFRMCESVDLSVLTYSVLLFGARGYNLRPSQRVCKLHTLRELSG